jgi:hypothetical protein
MTQLEQIGVDTARRLAKVDRLITRRNRADADLADSLLRILKSALGKELRDKIQEIATNG